MTDRQKGILLIIGSAFSFALMNVFVKAAGDLPSAQKSFFRNLIAMGVATVVLMRNHQGLHFEKKAWPSLLARSIFGTIGILCNYYAVDHLLLADASAIQKLVPFITIVASGIILKEKPGRFQVVLVILAFFCSLLVIKPSFANADLFASIIQVIGALGAGLAYTYVRKLTLMGVGKSQIIFFFAAFSTLVILPLVLMDYHPMSMQQLICLLLAGVMASAGQYTVTYAYSFAPASQIAIFDYSQIIFSALFGFFIFAQVPDTLSFVGYILIVGLAVLNMKAGKKTA